MSRNFLHKVFIVLMLGVLAGCSTEKNTRMSRAYHNLTAHYNVYFNGKESLKSGVERINNSVEDDYTKLLPIFKSSDPGSARTATSEMEYAIQKASKLIKAHSITKKPKRRSHVSEKFKKMADREEYNNWVDDAYVLMGQAYFYMHNFNSAVENFSYVVRKFDDKEIHYDASVWLIRAYTSLERYVEASEMITALGNDKYFPKRLEGELALVTADYHIKQLEYKEAIPFLEIASKKVSSKKSRIRYKYILAQLYSETGDGAKSSEMFREVAHMNPSYKMAFNARINAAQAFTGTGNAEILKKELKKMLRDKKNQEFRDQIYFAMANIAKNEGNADLAKDLYIKSATHSTSNIFQRALSCLTLADLYFDEPDYLKSQAYYDSAMVVIDEKYPNYKQIFERHADLSRLVENIYAVQREDSLQRIAKLSEPERNKLIDSWITKAKAEEERKKTQQQDEAMGRNMYRMNQSVGLGTQTSTDWYFYSATTVAYGRVQFKQTWGTRKLEDGWRRSNKLDRSEAEAIKEESKQKTDTVNNVVRVIDPKERNFYVQDLPLNDSLMVRSHERIRDALYNAGRIFKTVYNNYPRAIDSYLELNKRYPENIYRLPSYFELWDLYTKTGDLTNASLYKDRIIQDFPESNYAKYLQNPNYFIELEAKKDSLNKVYRMAFSSFKQGKYAEVSTLAQQMMTMKPDTVMIPKIDFLQAVSSGILVNLPALETSLTSYVAKYPKGEVSPLAEEIIKLIKDSTLVDYQKLVQIGYLSDEIKNEELKKENKANNDEFGGKFSYDEELLHYFVIAYPSEAKVDLNKLKFDIANFNIDHYTKIDFDIETENLSKGTKLVLVRSLENKEQALIYFRSIIRKREVFRTLGDEKYVNFVISSQNYRELLSEKDDNEYLKFFIKNYSRFISNDFPEDIIPEPEELIAKAKAEEDKLEEKGTFVMVNTGRRSMYKVEPNVTQNFVVSISDPDFSTRQLMSAFATFNRKNFAEANLRVTQEEAGNDRLLVVRSFKDKNEALLYFTKVITNRQLFSSLGKVSYRNFLISDGNLEKLMQTGTVENYFSFFSDVYLKNGGDAAQSGDETGEVTTPAAKTESSAKATANTASPVAPKPAQPAYTGAFNTNIEGPQLFILLVPSTGIDKAGLLSAIETFNRSSFGSLPLKVSEAVFDDTRIVLLIEGLSNKKAAVDYLKAIIANKQIYGPLENVDYRNFVITAVNLDILLKNKDIKEYISFFRIFYLN